MILISEVTLSIGRESEKERGKFCVAHGFQSTCTHINLYLAIS